MLPLAVAFVPQALDPDEGPRVLRLRVVNPSDHAIRVGSHMHFSDADRVLCFDREAARGHHLKVQAGTVISFAPGLVREVDLVPFAGACLAYGFVEELPWPLED